MLLKTSRKGADKRVCHRPISSLQVERSQSEHFLEQLEARGLNPSTINTL